MTRELVLASIVAATWLTLCFVGLGATYSLVSGLFGGLEVWRFELLLGTISLPGGASVPRLALIGYGFWMLVAVVPINFYWLRRIRG